SVSSSLIAMYGKCGCLETAAHVFHSVARKDLVCWNAMIAIYGQAGHIVRSLETFHSLHLEGMLPDQVTFVCVLAACSHAGLLEVGYQIFCSITVSYGLSLLGDHCRCMVDLLGRSGRLEEAEELIRSMPSQAGSSAWTSLLASCRIHSD
ncbi:hypothetical protein SELMODRAFT_72097, partial [Selaginella moellendorffii]